MNPPSMSQPARNPNSTASTNLTRRFSELYFGYASNLSPSAMKGRCPDSLFCGLARLDGWKWKINSTRYANIIPSAEDHVYGALFFLSPRDEAGLDESEGVPWMYEKKRLEVERVEGGQRVQVMTYLDVARPDEGIIMPDYVIWINKAIRDARPFGLPEEYVERYLRPWIPVMTEEELREEEERDIQMVRVMRPA